MKCPRCGAANGDEQAFCDMCLTPLKRSGKTNTNDDQTNPELGQSGPQQVQAGTRSGSKRSAVLVISLVIAAVFGIAICLWFYPSPVELAKKATRLIHTGSSVDDTTDLLVIATNESKRLAAPTIMCFSNMFWMMSQGKPGKFTISDVKKVIVQGDDAQVDLAIITDMGPLTQHVHLVREGVFPLKRWMVDLKDTKVFVGMQEFTKARGGMSPEQLYKFFDETNRQMQEKIKPAQQGQ
ncbi:MAG: hypothetical protein ACYC27_03655 [Armatimonadota bacterium]